MKKQIFLAAAVILFIGNSLPANVTVELPLNCAGNYSPDWGWSLDFDLGVEFTDISHVYIDWSGEITAAMAVNYSNPDDPFPVDVEIVANFGSNPYLRNADVWGGKNEYPNPKPFDLISEVELVGGSTWSDLLDGKGHMDIYYSSPGMLFGYVVEPGSVKLNDATLMVEGTLVPVPSSIILLAMGTGVIIMRRKNFM